MSLNLLDFSITQKQKQNFYLLIIKYEKTNYYLHNYLISFPRYVRSINSSSEKRYAVKEYEEGYRKD